MCQLEVVGSFRCGRATEAAPRDSHELRVRTTRMAAHCLHTP